MTQQQKRQIVVGLTTTLLGALVLFLASATKESFVSRPTFDAHVADKATELQDLRTMMQRVDERTARIERYICRREPGGLGC